MNFVAGWELLGTVIGREALRFSSLAMVPGGNQEGHGAAGCVLQGVFAGGCKEVEERTMHTYRSQSASVTPVCAGGGWVRVTACLFGKGMQDGSGRAASRCRCNPCWIPCGIRKKSWGCMTRRCARRIKGNNGMGGKSPPAISMRFLLTLLVYLDN